MPETRVRRGLLAAALLLFAALIYLLALTGPRRADAGVGRAAGAEEGNARNAARVPEPAARASRAVTRRAPRSAGPELRVGLAELVATLAEELRGTLPAHPSFTTYRECALATGAVSSRCQSLTADVINYALFLTKARQRIGGDEIGLRALVGEQARAAVALLTQTVTSASDPLERVAALLMMHYDAALSEQARDPLPETAYRDLPQRPLPEVALIAERHRMNALTGTRIEEFVRLADSSDTRAMGASVMALGHPQTAAQLHEVVLGLPLDSETWTDMATALSRCGMACWPSLQYLIASSPQARIAVYEALGIAPEAERRQLVELAIAHAPVDVDERERALRDGLLRDALAN
jgi:hypothetical protein